ncbi:MAG TPA: CBS domain-containing protein, partial [bacterium]
MTNTGVPSRAVARAVMKTDLVTVAPDTPLADAIRLLMKHRISGLPVVDAQQRLVGIVTEKDLLRLLYEERGVLAKAADVMSTGVRAFQADDPLELICDCLMANHFRRVPILEGDRL